MLQSIISEYISLALLYQNLNVMLSTSSVTVQGNANLKLPLT